MNKPIQGLLIFILLAFIQACAIAPQEVWQKFAFDGRTDGWDLSTDLLEYDYGGHEKMAGITPSPVQETGCQSSGT